MPPRKGRPGGGAITKGRARAAAAIVLAGALGGGALPLPAAEPAPGSRPGPAHACAPDSLAPLDRPSLWGPLPAPADSVTAVLLPLRIPLWHRLLLLPHDIVSFPAGLLAEGLAGGIYLLHDEGVIAAVSDVLAGIEGPFDTRIAPNVTGGGLLGWGGGLTIRRDESHPRSSRFHLRWQSTTRRSHRLTTGFFGRAGRRATFELGAGYRFRPNARYFGLGPFTGGDDESWYSHELAWGGASLERSLLRIFAVEAEAIFSTVGHRGPGVDVGPPVESRYAGALPPGWGGRSDGWTLGLSLVQETASETGRPSSGGLRRLSARRFFSSDGSGVGYWNLRAEAQQFLPLWHFERSLALRAFIAWLEPDGRDRIHFQRLLTNDEPDLLRGYEDFRWRDQGMAAFTAEYRWPIWVSASPPGRGLDAYLFSDVGQVYGHAGELGLRNLTTSFGGGLRLIGAAGNFNARIEVAASGEETVFRLRGDQIFQFGRGGLYHGRDPVPER